MAIELKWFPPSWVQIRAQNKIIYIDPAYLKKYYKNSSKKVEFSSWPDPIDGLPEKDLELADIILVTHHHKDHCKLVTVNRLKKTHTAIIAPDRCVKELGKNITIIEANKDVRIDNVRIKTVDAYNRKKSGRKNVAHRKGIGVGYVITVDGKSIYHAGDTDLVPELGNLGKVEVAFLPIGGRDFTMNLADAVRAAVMIQPEIVVPIHWFEADPQKFKKEVEKKSSTEVKVLQIGEVFSL